MPTLDATTPQTDAANPQTMEYLLLGRLKHDCDHYLGHGERNKTRLWAGDEAEQIAKMKELYAGLLVKPQWLAMEDIQRFEAEMVA